MSKFNHYRVFLEVAKTGSISQAALSLNLSAPAISKQLNKLEESLQVQLFHRSHKKLEITEAGKRFYPKCKNILSSIAQIEDELIAEKDAINGTIAITLSKALARSNIFDVFAIFTDKHPDVKFDIRFSDDIEDLYDENLDFAFRLGKLEDSSHMIAMPLIQTQLMACATPKYLAKHGTPKHLSQLDGAKLIMMHAPSRSEALTHFFNKEQFQPNNSNMHLCSDIEGVYQAILAGLGIGMLLDITIEKELKNGTFSALFTQQNLPKKRLYLLYKKSQWRTKKITAFKAHIKSSLTTDQQA